MEIKEYNTGNRGELVTSVPGDLVRGGPRNTRVVVYSVSVGPLLKGDILIRLAGHPVGGRSLGRYLARIGAGEPVDIVVVRDGKRVNLKLTLAERPERRRP